MKWFWSIIVALTAVVAGCMDRSAPSLPRWNPVSESDLTEPQRQQRALAVGARDELFGRLTHQLETVGKSDGLVKAVAVCKEQAPTIAQAVSNEQRLRIGRTSFKLRNPANQPPEWAREWVRDQAAEAKIAAHSDGRLGVLLPIFLKDQCVVCHGSSTQIGEAVRAELTAHYPEDQAVGFAVGDLRGWFWIEVPEGGQ